MRIVTGKIRDLNGKEKSACRSLSYRADGDLSEWLTYYPDADVVRVLDGNMLIGWGVKTPYNKTGYYVRSKYRRQGIGSKIYYTLNKPRTAPIIFPHDKRSASFFYALGRVRKDQLDGWGIDSKTVKRKPRSKVMN